MDDGCWGGNGAADQAWSGESRRAHWSPDNRHLAFFLDGADADLHVDTTEAQPVPRQMTTCPGCNILSRSRASTAPGGSGQRNAPLSSGRRAGQERGRDGAVVRGICGRDLRRPRALHQNDRRAFSRALFSAIEGELEERLVEDIRGPSGLRPCRGVYYTGQDERGRRAALLRLRAETGVEVRPGRSQAR